MRYRTIAEIIPVPNGFLAWDDMVDAAREWGFPADELAVCQQDLVHHGEGDVLTHTRMVLESLVASNIWEGADLTRRGVLLLSALLHDVAKPATKSEEDGRVHHRAHAHRGEKMARHLLWRAELAPAERELVCNLIRWHQTPFWAYERDQPKRLVREIAETVSTQDQAALARADSSGRLCEDHARLDGSVELFELLAEEAGVEAGPYPFLSDAARFTYFNTDRPDEFYVPFEADGRPTLHLCSGLPASGKSTWAASTGLPIISLDAIRRHHGLSHAGPQGEVLALAKEQLRAQLRSGTSVVWDATSSTRQLRAPIIELAVAYGARVEAHHFEVGPELLRQRNQARSAEEQVPTDVLSSMAGRWEPPTSVECWRLHHHLGG